MNLERVNVWTNTFYALVHSLYVSKQINFGNLTLVDASLKDASTWVTPDCSYASVLLDHQSGGRKITFRRDPNKHFADISNQVIKMLIQDLVVILDEMMTEVLDEKGVKAGGFPQSKIEKLSKYLDPKYTWALQGCLELVAARNVLSHCGGVWNDRTLKIIKSFVTPTPKRGEKLCVGFDMIFRYRKAMRTFLNEVARP